MDLRSWVLSDSCMEAASTQLPHDGRASNVLGTIFCFNLILYTSVCLTQRPLDGEFSLSWSELYKTMEGMLVQLLKYVLCLPMGLYVYTVLTLFYWFLNKIVTVYQCIANIVFSVHFTSLPMSFGNIVKWENKLQLVVYNCLVNFCLSYILYENYVIFSVRVKN